MTVQLAPMSTRVSVRPSDDPYKKYWWLILVGFGVTGAWVSLPMMETSVGSTRIDTSAPAESMPSGEGSLDSSDNPNGAQGSTLDLSMDIAAGRRKKGDGTLMSSLYQAPEEETPGVVEAPTAGAAAAGGTLASALAKAASSDPSGWGGQKAQKGFTQPKLGGSMPGLGGGGGGSGASASAGGGTSAFGQRNAQVGSVGTQGLKGSVGDMAAPKDAKGALTRAASKATQAANLRSKDGQVSGLSQVFDGRSQRGGAAIGGDGGEAIGAGGISGSLDAAPSNLKLNDPNLDKKEFKEPPAKVANTRDNSSEEFKQQIAMMVVTTVVGGVVGGAAGGIITSLGSQLAQAWQTKQRSESQLKDKQSGG
jgi:hypothetical protein